MTFCSNTLVKNGMPFIDLVLRQVIPYMNHCFVTISKKSIDGTKEAILALQEQYPDKIIVNYEDVEKPADLTHIRQAQIDASTDDWILFLDDDDYWPIESIEEIIQIIDNMPKSIDALAVNPYQLIDQDYYDDSWRNRWFTKWFKNQEGLHYRKPWPRDLIYLDDHELYWRKNSKVLRVRPKYFHLSNIKPYSFRNQKEFQAYKETVGKHLVLPLNVNLDIERIYERIK